MFDIGLGSDESGKRLALAWSKRIPGLIRVPVFSERTNAGYVVSYKEKSRSYVLHRFDPETGAVHWEIDLVNGGYGSPPVGLEVLAVPTRFTDVTGVDLKTGEIRWIFHGNARVRSPVAFAHNDFWFSSGSRLLRVAEDGTRVAEWSAPDHFLFGLPRVVADRVLTCATWTNAAGRSQIGVLCFSLCGGLRWKADLGPGQVISSDTSGFALDGDRIYACGERSASCLFLEDGSTHWTVPLGSLVGRQMPTVTGGSLLIPSIDGRVFCLEKADGQLRWVYAGDTIVNTPVSCFGDLVGVSLDGHIVLINSATGKPFDQIATGHSPYSALIFWRGKAYVGGGDPPYHGRLYCFEVIDRDKPQQFLVKASGVMQNQDQLTCYVHAEVTNVSRRIVRAVLDASALSAAITNGMISEFSPIERAGDRFTFEVPIRSSIVAGQYAIDFLFELENGERIWRTGIVAIEREAPMPRRHILGSFDPVAQTDVLHSGAAVAQMIQGYFQQPVTEQDKFREIVDYVRDRSGYERFNTWRIVMRRAASTAARSAAELPEYEGERPGI